MVKIKNKHLLESLTEKADDVSFKIDASAFASAGISFQYLLYQRLCRLETCAMCKKLGVTKGDVYPLPKERDMIRTIGKHCFKQEGYLNSFMTLSEAVFLLLIRNGNRPLSATQVIKDLAEIWSDIIHLKNISASNVVNTLSEDNSYCIAVIKSEEPSD